MNRVNLLPPDRQAANRHRRARRRWLVINSIYAIALAVVGAGYVVSRPALPEAFVGPTPDLAALNTTLVSLRQQSAQLLAAARSSANASERADFSRLLAAVARAKGDDVTLESVEMTAAKDATTPHVLVLAGVGRSHAVVTQFALRVEAMGVFAAVRLTDVTAQPMGATECVGFRLQCPMPVEGR